MAAKSAKRAFTSVKKKNPSQTQKSFSTDLPPFDLSNLDNLRDIYLNKVKSSLKGKYALNDFAIPEIEKISLTTTPGVQSMSDKGYVQILTESFGRICAQKPMLVKAKKSISTFKVKEGMPAGLKVTLRKRQMYNFLTRLVYITLPRIRDFKGLSASALDEGFNFNIGIADCSAFHEVDVIKLNKTFGLNISIHVKNANSREQVIDLLRGLLIPVW